MTHEHVVTIHAVDEADGTPFLVMEYIVGVSLEDRIQRSGHLRVEEILRIGMQAAAGLAAAHAQGLVHRDIKPSNILLENGVERVKITDFGLARVIHEAQSTQSNVVAGTPQYMSPEQARGETVDHRSDLFSLGCVLYAMCVGRSPFRAETPTGAIHRVCEDTPASHPRNQPRHPRLAGRRHRPAAGEEAGRPLPVGHRSGRRPGAVLGPRPAAVAGGVACGSATLTAVARAKQRLAVGSGSRWQPASHCSARNHVAQVSEPTPAGPIGGNCQ